MKVGKHISLALTLIAISVSSITLSAESLFHDLSTGSLSTWNLGTTASSTYDVYSTNINSLATGTEYYSYPGFVGRLIYQGEGNTLTVLNGGPVASSSNGRFYFTAINRVTRWREFVIVLRVKGLTQSGGTVDYVGTNYVISAPGQSIPVVGAGDQTVAIGELGYNSTGGGPVVYNGSNGYQYKHRFKYLWIDVTLMRTEKVRDYKNSFYETYIEIIGTGVHAVITKAGERGSPSGTDPMSYVFSVERAEASAIPFSDLISRTSMATSYLAGYVNYMASDWRARVYFASNSTGTATDFRFSATVNGINRTFPYYVAFVPVQPSGTTRTISSTSITFPTTSSPVTVSSPINGTNTVYILRGELRIFVSAGMTMTSIPAETYSSAIYCFVTTY
ncbi:MAG: hypothetical protein CVV52_10665 [Spirochaetae bacterium HGW-Spirochaetae-8]|nr:MAG: hypothetical protein CVV52_10665 [Spirochaetae bacterium HGW-Spirochaetae-8]